MQDPFEKMHYNKKSMLALFVLMSKSDNDIDEKEEIFIEEMREKLGVSKDELNHIWKNEDDYPIDPPKSERHRMTIMFQLLYLMAIDGVITSEERTFMHIVGLKLAVKPALTDDLIDKTEEHLGKELPDGLLASIITKHLN
jgi:uncharacterized tellurite resistance protein B-like protein